jgi:hypothetical protein
LVDLMARAVAGGYHNPAAFRRDPWLAPLRGHDAFQAAVAEAEAGRRASVEAYRAAAGETLLGAAR